MNTHRKNQYRLPHEDNSDDIAFYGSIAVGVFAILMIAGGML